MKNKEFFYTEFAITPKQKEKYNKYYELIYEYNQKMNLTGIDDEFGVYLKHFYDSLLLSKYILEEPQKIADLGSGAGFPGLVLAIYFPNKTFDLIEPMKKRCMFLSKVVEELELSNVNVINKRAEEIEKEIYEIIVARAVSKMSILLELSIPLLKKDGILIAQKGPRADLEILESFAALKTLNSEIISKNEEILPFEKSVRNNIVVRKIQSTNSKYPRNFGQIKKAPL